MRHTPGPWEVEYCAKHTGYHIRTDEEGGLATVASGGDKDYYNARLIAAAPELLAACEEMAELTAYYGTNDVRVELGDRLRAAIAKARSGERA